MTNDDLLTLVQNLWVIVAAALVFFMQAGFCFVEAGTVRTKNNINVAVKNIIDMCATMIAYFLIGYALMFGASQAGFIGTPSLFLQGVDSGEMLSFLFQMTFCATAATIVSGAIAERCRFLPYVIMSLAIGLVIYPIFGHWVWGGGWLAEMGFKDFAGSSVVHMVGGAVGLAGIQVLGARAGRFAEDGTPTPIPASSMPQVALGVIILIFGWIGFNGGSAALSEDTPLIIVNTLLAAAFGGAMALLSTWAYRGLAGVELILNGILGGLVAITAGADVVRPEAAMLIGLAGGLVVVITTRMLEAFKLDDAVGAVPVHFFAGVVGILLIPALCIPEAVPEGGRSAFFGVQLIGVVACTAWAWGLGWVLWTVISFISPLRVGPAEEQVGLNFSEHQVRDPMAETASLLARAAKGEDVAAGLAQMDEMGFTTMGRNLALVLQRKGVRSEDMAAWARELEAARIELEARLAKGRQDRLDAADEASGAVGVVDRLTTHLEEHRNDSTLIPVVLDLLTSLRLKLDGLKDIDAGPDPLKAVRPLAELQNRMAGN